MTSTIPEARHLVNNRHILVNGRIVDIPSFRLPVIYDINLLSLVIL